jgi:hypothetical protein
MSCCAGQNAYIPVAIPLVNGDGPITSVAALAAKKTIYLTGTFTGDYVVLGSHDGTNFVPVAKFNGRGNPQSVKSDVDATLSSVRIRREADAPASITIASQLTCTCVQPPISFTCCPCQVPPGEGTPNPQNFCTEFPGGVIAPFVEILHDPPMSRTSSGDNTILSSNGTVNGKLFLAAPGPVVNPAFSPFCFCVTMNQDVSDPGFNHIGSYAGLTGGDPFSNSRIMIATANPSSGLAYPTYHLITDVNDIDTGVPIDGTSHKFVVCSTLTPGQYSLQIDDGAPSLIALTAPNAATRPFIGAEAYDQSTGVPFSLTVDSFCADSLQINLGAKKPGTDKPKTPSKKTKRG